MIAKQNLTRPSAYASLFAHESLLAYHKSRLFCRLRTLFPLLSPKMSRNPSTINRFRTLYKTTEGCDPRPVQTSAHTLAHLDPQTNLTPLESALTKTRTQNRTRNTPVSPLESVFTQSVPVT